MPTTLPARRQVNFAEQFNLRLFPHTWVTDIDAEAHVVKSQNNQWQYDKLVLATGARRLCPRQCPGVS